MGSSILAARFQPPPLAAALNEKGKKTKRGKVWGGNGGPFQGRGCGVCTLLSSVINQIAGLGAAAARAHALQRNSDGGVCA